jgi:hypothetical protein
MVKKRRAGIEIIDRPEVREGKGGTNLALEGTQFFPFHFS